MTTRGPCRYCGELHWNADCPKMAEKKSKKKAARAAKLAIKQKGNEPSREPDDSSKELKKPTMGAANLVTTGEMLISEEFFSGGEQSVALASGGGMVSLKGVKSKDKPCEFIQRGNVIQRVGGRFQQHLQLPRFQSIHQAPSNHQPCDSVSHYLPWLAHGESGAQIS